MLRIQMHMNGIKSAFSPLWATVILLGAWFCHTDSTALDRNHSLISTQNLCLKSSCLFRFRPISSWATSGQQGQQEAILTLGSADQLADVGSDESMLIPQEDSSFPSTCCQPQTFHSTKAIETVRGNTGHFDSRSESRPHPVCDF